MASLMMDYPKYEGLVYKTILSVWRSIGGDVEEMLSCAGTLYVKACQTYSKDRGSFVSHVRKVTWDDTYSARRGEIRRDQHRNKGVDLLTVTEPDRSGTEPFDLSKVVGDLSDEARRLLDLAFNPPAEVLRTKEGLPKQNSLFAYVKRTWQWSADQLTETVSEIQSVL